MTISTDNQQSRLASLPSLQQLKMATSVAKLFMYGALVASVSVLALATSRIVSTSPAKMLSRIFKSTGKADGITAVSAIDKSIRSSDERRQAALLGMYVADAVAMPVHWMYNLGQLKKDYGVIRSFVKPKDRFDGSIMNLSNTGGGGRGSDQGDIVGSVILHGKKKFWLRGGNFHYHLGLDAGENTLEAQLCRLLTQSILETSLSTPPNSDAPEPAPAPAFKPSHFTEKYMTFMQTPGSHNDTYASTAHRMFFANLVQGKAPSECADNDGHNTDAIDALTLTVPVIIAYADAPRNLRNTKIREVIAITRKSRVLQSYAETYSDILIAVLQGTPLREAIDAHDPSGSIRRTAEACRASGQDPMVACYIDSAFPAMLVFAYKYAESLEEGILASANAGGENVARGALLGALLGAQHGLQAFPVWTSGLKNKEPIMREIEQLVTLSKPTAIA